MVKNISLVRCAHSGNIFQHSKRNFVSPRSHVISSISPTAENHILTCEDINFILTVKSEDINILTSATMFALIKCQSSLKVLAYNRNIFGSSSEIFKKLLKSSELESFMYIITQIIQGCLEI